jgi:hypothetical protein
VLLHAVPLAPHEAVAVAQQVMSNRLAAGAVVDVKEAAALLDQLLAVTTPVPASLRLTATRANGTVDAPPIQSVHELSAALQHFESGDRTTVVRQVLARSQSPARRPRSRARARGLALAAGLAVIVAAAAYTGKLHNLHVPMTPRVVAVVPGGHTAADVPAAPRPRANQPPQNAVATTGILPTPVVHRKADPPLVRAVEGDRGPEFSPAFENHGTAVFFHTGRGADEPSALKALERLDGGLRVMTIVDDGARNYHVQPSPDGKRIAFDSDREGERAIYIARRDGTHVRRLTSGPYAAVPTWSPDGDRIAFLRAEVDRPRVWNVWIVTVRTGELRRVTTFAYGQTWAASWFPDGRQIAYTHESELITRDLETGEQRTFRSPVPRRLVRTAAVSPDGSHVMFQVSGSGAWLLNLRDESMLCVLTDPTAEEFAWAPDGRHVAFHSRRDGQWGIWIMTPS